MVVASGRAAALDDILLDGCGGAIFLDSEEGLLQLDGLRALACTGTVLELGPDQQVTLVGGLVSDHAGAPFVVGDGAVLSLLHGTFEDLSGGLASVLGGGQLTIARCLGVDVAAPAVVGNVTSIEMTDLWRSDQSDAWAGLEVFAGVVGNIEADPLFCDRAQGDLRLQPGTPCLLPDDSVMGALGIGCD
jgi:hypothetical protein